MTAQRSALKRDARTALAALGRLAPGHQTEIARLSAAAADSARLAGEPVLEAEALLGGGQHKQPLIDPAQVLAGLRRAETIFAANRMVAKAASCLVGQANALSDLGRESLAIRYAEQALDEPVMEVRDRVAALLVVVTCQLHCGNIDSAWQRLIDSAEPLAQRSAQPVLMAQILCYKALTQMSLLIALHHRDLWLAYPAAPKPLLRPVPLQDLLKWLDDAERLLEDQDELTHINMCRQGCLALFCGDAGAMQKLETLARLCWLRDPPLAVRALFVQALVWRHQGLHERALATLDRALLWAGQHGQASLARSIHLQQSLAWEALDNSRNGLACLRLHTGLLIHSLLLEDESIRSVPHAPAAEGQRVEAVVEPPALRRLAPAYVRKAVRFIDENLSRSLRVTDVVEYSGVARRTLETAFREVKSVSVGDYIAQQKMAHAAETLLHTTEPVHAVAAGVGYRSAAAFTREFRNRYGVLPSQWRLLANRSGPAD